MPKVNSYGAFGSITKERTEVVLQGTRHTGDPRDAAAVWLDYEFKCKPGDIARRPCLISPFHYRLDWLAWFAAFGSYQQHPWLIHLAVKLLQNDGLASGLLAHNPFLEDGGGPPTYIRAQHFRYRYAAPADIVWRGQWWRRELLGPYFPPLALNNPSLRQFVLAHGWPWPEK